MKTYILAYTLRKHAENTHVDTDHYEVFSDEDLGTNRLDAEKRLMELEINAEMGGADELYCWNIAHLVSTSEHYE